LTPAKASKLIRPNQQPLDRTVTTWRDCIRDDTDMDIDKSVLMRKGRRIENVSS
jgi:hypothetical protein